MNDGDIDLKRGEETAREKRLVDQLMNVRGRASYLQKKVGSTHLSKNRELTGDAELEFAKASKKYGALPEPHLQNCPQHVDNNYVIIDKALTEAQIQSISASFKHQSFSPKQIFLSNNQLTGKQFELMLRSLTSEQRNRVKSIVYGGANELTGESYEALKELYLSKRRPNALRELKLV
jgi:hypothetical protein